MYFKIALGNVKKSFMDYSIYFLTLMFGICIFYLFNSIESQESMMKLSSSQAQSLQSLTQILDIISVFVSVILGFLIIYANNFLVRRRKKEFGIYQVLGMSKSKISKILIAETSLIGLVSIVVGVVLGVLISQVFSLITASLFEIKLNEFKFIFSLAATGKAVLYFSIAFICVILFNNIEIGRQKLINLLYADKKNENIIIHNLLLSVFLFITSVACLVVAYIIILNNTYLRINASFWTSVILGIIGTFLFFFSLSGFFLKVLKQRPKVYLKGLNMFVLRQINSKINTTYVSMTFVCLMLFITISFLSSGMSLSNAMTADLEKLSPYDGMLITEIDQSSNTNNSKDKSALNFNLLDKFNEVETKPSQYAKDIEGVRLYKGSMILNATGEYNIMSLSDYNKLLKMQGKPKVSLNKEQFILNSTDPKVAKELIKKEMKNKEFSILGNKLTLKESKNINLLNRYSTVELQITMVVNDSYVQNASIYQNIVAVNLIKPNHKYDDLFNKATSQVNSKIESMKNNSIVLGIPFSKITTFESSKGTSAIIAFMSIYIGIVFLLTSAVVIAITQLSESSDNAKRYDILRKLGADKKMINKALFRQISIYFMIPLVLAVVHATVAINVVNNLLSKVADINILNDSLLAATVIVVIYGGYFLATYVGSKRIINQR